MSESFASIEMHCETTNHSSESQFTEKKTLTSEDISNVCVATHCHYGHCGILKSESEVSFRETKATNSVLSISMHAYGIITVPFKPPIFI